MESENRSITLIISIIICVLSLISSISALYWKGSAGDVLERQERLDAALSEIEDFVGSRKAFAKSYEKIRNAGSSAKAVIFLEEYLSFLRDFDNEYNNEHLVEELLQAKLRIADLEYEIEYLESGGWKDLAAMEEWAANSHEDY